MRARERDPRQISQALACLPAALVVGLLAIATAACAPDSSGPESSGPAHADLGALQRGQRPTDVRTANPAVEPPPSMEQVQARLRAEREARQKARSLITASYEGIDERGFPIVRLRNATGRAIDDVRGGFHIEDAEGGYVFSSGQTEAVPGDIFLEADASRDLSPYGLNRKDEVMERLRSDPTSLRVYFEVLELVYADGTRESLGY